MDEKLLKYFKGDEFTASTWLKKYAVKDENGTPVETDPYQMFDRLAKEFARIENNYNEDDKMSKDEIFELFKDFKYIVPGGSVMSGLGSEKLVSFSNCFIAGTKVLTTRGLINIEDINEGDFVLSDDGEYHRVNATMSREYFGDLYKIQCDDAYDTIICTPNHKFLTNNGWKRADRILACNKQIHSSDKLKTALSNNKLFANNGEGEEFDITEGFSSRNRTIVEEGNGVILEHSATKKRNNKINKILRLDSDLAYFIGRWIGDGSITRRVGEHNPSILQIVFNATTENDAFERCKRIGEEKFGLKASVSYTKQNIIALRFENELLSTWFLNHFGEKCDGKFIPDKYLGNFNILLGLCDADGMLGSHGYFKIALKNKQLIEWVRHTMYLNNINASNIKESYYDGVYELFVNVGMANGRLNQFLTKTYHDKRHEIIASNKGEYTKIKSIDIIENQQTMVYNISVEDTHTYNVNGIVCHNCFVIDSPHDSYESIMRTRAYQVQLMSRRGGVGYDLSKLRPSGARVNNAAMTSTGAASYMDVNSAITNEVAQQGRRGALMLTISISHPDVEEFISKKQDLTKVTGANISVKVTDEFMQAVKDDTDYVLRFPVDTNLKGWFEIDSLPYNELVKIEEDNNPKNRVYLKRIKAKDLWNKLVHCAWNTAEPGVIFEDRMHNYAPDGVYGNYKMVSTNPCVSGDTMLNTSVGKMTIKELVDLYDRGHSGITVESWNINRHVAEMQVVKFAQLTQHNANLIKITTDNGNTLRLTLDHMVYTIKNGYKEAKCLVEGDELLVYDNDTRMYVPNKVVSITQDGCEDVYDIGVEYNHNFFANGILVHNCGEIGMNKDSCRLIAMNLTGYVENPFTPNAKFNYDLFKEHTYKAVKLGDDLVDLELEQVNGIIDSLDDDETLSREIWSMLRDTAIKVRRLGLGFTGMGDMLAMMNLKYGSEESKGFLNTVLDTMFRTQLESEVKLAKSRGKFEEFDAVLEGGKDGKEPQNDFFKFIYDNYNDIWNEMMVVGRRNISWSTLAPCGTISILTKTTSGVEPLFMPFYERKRKCMSPNDRVDYIDKVGEKYQLFVIVHEGLKQWANIAKGISFDEMDNFTIDTWKELYQESPYYMACAQDLDWPCRNDMQSVIQCYTSHSISSTCNLANDVTEGIVSDLYFDAWEKGLKGTTIYRDGCREGVLTQISKKREDDKFDESYVNAPKRPKSLEADFYTTKVKGEIFYVMIGLYHNKPYEIFVYRAGSDAKVVKNHKGVITKVKKNHYKFDSDVIKLNDLASKLNTEELATVLYSSMLMRTGANIKYIVKTSKKVDENISSFTSAMNRIISKYIPVESVDGEVCPQCGGKIIRENGCQHCADCDWSKCG